MTNEKTKIDVAPAPVVIDLREFANVIPGINQVMNWVESGAVNSAIEILCPHMQLRDFLGQYLLDVNHNRKALVFRVNLMHFKNFGEIVREGFSIYATKNGSVVPNRKERRAVSRGKKK